MYLLHYWRAKHPTAPISLQNACCWICFGFSVPQNTRVLNVHKSSDVEGTLIKKWFDVRDQIRTTCFPYRIEKSKFIEHIFVVSTDVLVQSCTKLYKPAVSGGSAWWRMESINLQLIFSMTVLRAGRGKNWLFATSFRNLGALLTSFVSKIPVLTKLSNHQKTVMCAGWTFRVWIECSCKPLL